MDLSVASQPVVERHGSSESQVTILNDHDDSLDADFEQQPEDSALPEEEDMAQAALQPSMSAAASHLTSAQTPAVEKAAAMDDLLTGENPLFAGEVSMEPSAIQPDDSGSDSSTPGDSSSPEKTPRLARADQEPQLSLGSLPQPNPSQAPPLPSPWQVGARDWVIKDGRSRQTKGLLGTAFGPARSRSRSAGQEALKKLRGAMPSFSSSSQFLPSLPSSFLSSMSERNFFSTSPKPTQTSFPDSPTTPKAPQRPSMPLQQSSADTLDPRLPRRNHASSNPSQHSSRSSSRPPTLKRVTSDDSVLYNSLSRASSLGENANFTDVREMVNMRLMALKDSLPDVPNFKMPSIAKIQAASKRSSYPFYGKSPSAAQETFPPLDRETSSSSPVKDGTAALDRVLEGLTGDIVVMGGYRGSILRSAEPPHQQLWAPVKLGFNMRKANLEVGLDPEDEENMEKTIIPSGMLQHIGPIDVSRKFFKRLRSCENARNGRLRVWDYGYDWRLSPKLLSRNLQEFLRGLPCNAADVPAESRGALVIAHSLGGLLTRHAVNQQPDLFSGVLYAGTPQRCVNILGPFRNGDAVLFNEKLLSAQVNFSIRTSFLLLPEDGFCFIDKTTREEYPVDFFDPQEWVKWHLSPCVQPALAPFNRPQSSSLSSLLPSPLRARADSRGAEATTTHKDRTIAPKMNSGTTRLSPAARSSQIPPSPLSPGFGSGSGHDRERYLEYLTRVLSETKQFRSELVFNEAHHTADTYPPLAVLYGKSIPTVYAAQVNGREAIPCSDAYDELLFRAGDGVVLAKEAMLPEGYSVVRGGRVRTQRGHITMLGDMPALAKALEALLRGRRKGIGLGRNAVEKEGTEKSGDAPF